MRPAPGDAFVRDFAAFWADPDPDRIPDLVHEDIVARVPGSTDELHGVAAYQAQIGSLLQLVDGFRIEVIDHLAEDDRVVIEWRGEGTIDGQPYATEGIDRFRLRDGKVSDARVVFDTPGCATRWALRRRRRPRKAARRFRRRAPAYRRARAAGARA